MVDQLGQLSLCLWLLSAQAGFFFFFNSRDIISSGSYLKIIQCNRRSSYCQEIATIDHTTRPSMAGSQGRVLSGFKNVFIIRLFWLSECCYPKTAAVLSVFCVSCVTQLAHEYLIIQIWEKLIDVAT